MQTAIEKNQLHISVIKYIDKSNFVFNCISITFSPSVECDVRIK